MIVGAEEGVCGVPILNDCDVKYRIDGYEHYVTLRHRSFECTTRFNFRSCASFPLAVPIHGLSLPTNFSP